MSLGRGRVSPCVEQPHRSKRQRELARDQDRPGEDPHGDHGGPRLFLDRDVDEVPACAKAITTKGTVNTAAAVRAIAAQMSSCAEKKR